FFVVRLFSVSESEISAPIESFTDLVEEVASEDSAVFQNTEEELDGEIGEYAVDVKMLEGNGEEAAYNENNVFWSASLYKLWVMESVFKQIKEGNLSLSQELSASNEELKEQYDIATESAELKEGEVVGT